MTHCIGKKVCRVSVRLCQCSEKLQKRSKRKQDTSTTYAEVMTHSACQQEQEASMPSYAAIQEEAKLKARNVFEQFESITISYVFAQNKGDTEKMQECNDREMKILDILETDEEQEAFDALFLAEYKEMIYDSIYDPTFKKVESDILAEYHAYAMRNFDIDYLYESKHDPFHFVFDGYTGKYSYSFHYMLEVEGKNVFEIWEHPDFARQNIKKNVQDILAGKPIHDIRDDEYNKDIDAFHNLLMAEYKELVYRSIYDESFTDADNNRLDRIDEYVYYNLADDFVKEHKHNPDHYIFDHPYKFYTELESKGLDVLADWQMTSY